MFCVQMFRDYIYRKLGANPEAHPVVMTEKPFLPDTTRNKIAEIFFEKLNVPAMYFGIQSVFSMYASGRTTGTLVFSCSYFLSLSLSLAIFLSLYFTLFLLLFDFI
jgi:actin-related protein